MKNLALLAALGSLGMMLGAWGFQYIGDMAPCELCLWQRWPHKIAIGLGVVMFFLPNRWIALLGSLVVFVGVGIAFYHAGVELKYWPGPDTCTGLPDLVGTLSVDALWARPVVRCDDIPWSLFGISMAGWNGIISIGLGGMWLLSVRQSPKERLPLEVILVLIIAVALLAISLALGIAGIWIAIYVVFSALVLLLVGLLVVRISKAHDKR